MVTEGMGFVVAKAQKNHHQLSPKGSSVTKYSMFISYKAEQFWLILEYISWIILDK